MRWELRNIGLMRGLRRSRFAPLAPGMARRGRALYKANSGGRGAHGAVGAHCPRVGIRKDAGSLGCPRAFTNHARGVLRVLWFFVNREMRDVGNARGVDLGQSPGLSVLAVTLGSILIVPPFVSIWRTGRRMEGAQQAVGESDGSGPLFLCMSSRSSRCSRRSTFKASSTRRG